MNPDFNETVSTKPQNERELEAANNACFDAWTQGARDFFKGARRLVENIDDHSTMLLTDIFGPSVAQEHSLKLEVEADRAEAKGNIEAANHYKRRDLNFSRSTLGEFDQYTVKVQQGFGQPSKVDDQAKERPDAATRYHVELRKGLIVI